VTSRRHDGMGGALAVSRSRIRQEGAEGKPGRKYEG
jgi:hypothetical protein